MKKTSKNIKLVCVCVCVFTFVCPLHPVHSSESIRKIIGKAEKHKTDLKQKLARFMKFQPHTVLVL